MPLFPTNIDYDSLMEQVMGGNQPIATDIAKAVLWSAMDPTGLYRAAGNALLAYLDKSKLTEDDASNLREILKAGQDAGCDELEIEIGKDRFAGLRGGIVDPGSGINVHVEAGASGDAKYKIRATYK